MKVKNDQLDLIVERTMSSQNIKVAAVFRTLEETLSAIPKDRLL